MMGEKIKALTFDTGGTILDWHSGFYNALSKIGEKYGMKKDWHVIANVLQIATTFCRQGKKTRIFVI